MVSLNLVRPLCVVVGILLLATAIMNTMAEFDNNPNFKPYYGEGIIALDACTPISGKVNCIVVED